ncbi:CAP domain-containing protein [Psychrobacillus sp.]|uniref:CAP domain-containing protein n=1 Tax=Psychrobacillus sp. TaxID=1871623 RepID=UPI0028BDF2C9|nr:CAP domain-containing protein [Psychrobacillus sp.]
MNKKHSLIVGALAGGLLFSTNTAEASMTTGNSHTTSEANISIMTNWTSPYKVMYKNDLSEKNITDLLNSELKNLNSIIIDKIIEGQKPVVPVKPPVAEKPSVPVKPPVTEKPSVPVKPPVTEKPSVPVKPPVTEKPSVPVKPPVTEKPSVPVKPPVTEDKEEVTASATIQQVVDLTNKERAKAGLKALQMDAKLTQSAQAKSQDMKNNNYFSHTSPTYGSPFDQMKSFGITYKSAAENIAMGQRSAAEVVDSWMKSPGHKANIMNPSYTHIGVGLSNSGYYWTQQFIGK